MHPSREKGVLAYSRPFVFIRGSLILFAAWRLRVKFAVWWEGLFSHRWIMMDTDERASLSTFSTPIQPRAALCLSPPSVSAPVER
jgi:hypothetical protein